MNCTFLDDNKIVIGNNAFDCTECPDLHRLPPHKCRRTLWEPKPDGSFEFPAKPELPRYHLGTMYGSAEELLLCRASPSGTTWLSAQEVSVTKDIPSNVIAYGNPCRIARKND